MWCTYLEIPQALRQVEDEGCQLGVVYISVLVGSFSWDTDQEQKFWEIDERFGQP